MKKIIFTLIITLITLYIADAQVTNTAQSSGLWETSANWSQGHAPLNTEVIIIPASIVMTINSADVCASLTIAAMGQLTITAANSLTISGSLQNNGTFTAGTNTTLTFNGAANSAITGSGTITVNYMVLNLSAKTTVLDIQSNNFITGIN